MLFVAAAAALCVREAALRETNACHFKPGGKRHWVVKGEDRVIKSSVDKINLLIAWMQRHRRIMPSGEVVKVNFGSGHRCGWVDQHRWRNLRPVCRLATAVLKTIYRFSECRQWQDEESYIRR